MSCGSGLAGGTLAYQDQELTLHRHGDPEQVWMDLDYSPILDEDGEAVGVIAVVVETTAKVRAERALLESEAKLRALNETLEQQVEERTRERDLLWDTSEDLLAYADFEGTILRVSPSWVRTVGHSEEFLAFERLHGSRSSGRYRRYRREHRYVEADQAAHSVYKPASTCRRHMEDDSMVTRAGARPATASMPLVET